MPDQSAPTPGDTTPGDPAPRPSIRCQDCGVTDARHHNISRRWECWEAKAIQAEWDYWALPTVQRWFTPAPPELTNTTAEQRRRGAKPTYLARRPDLLIRLWKALRR